MKNVIVCFWVLLVNIDCHAQDQWDIWGLGLLMFDTAQTENFEIPLDGLSCFDSLGHQIGRIVESEYQLNFIQNNGSSTEVCWNDLNHYGYGKSYLKYYALSGEHVLVLQNSVDIQVWVSIGKDYTNAQSYEHLLELKLNDGWLVIPSSECVEVVSEPFDYATTLGCIKNTHGTTDYGVDIELTGKKDGSWMEVYVTEFDFEDYMVMNPNPPAKVTNEFRGWIEVVKKDGSPTLWYFKDGY